MAFQTSIEGLRARARELPGLRSLMPARRWTSGLLRLLAYPRSPDEYLQALHPDWAVNIALQNDSTVARWTPIAKDGADLPANLQTAQLARTRMGPGETADFSFTPSVPGDWVITVHAAPGGFTVTQRIRVVRPGSQSRP